MIIIDFRLQHSIIEKYRERGIVGEDAGVIEWTFFEMPVRMCVNGVELLEVRSIDHSNIISPWVDVPLLGFALIGEEMIRKACTGKSVIFTLPDVGADLHISSISKNEVQIYSGLNRLSIQVNCNDLLREFLEFVKRVKDMFMEEVPEIREHPVLGKWIDRD